MKYKIIIDSSCDLKDNYLDNTDIGFATVPFIVNVGDREFIDDEKVNTPMLLQALENFNGKPVSACPSPQSYLDKFTGAEKYFVVTISSKLSGSYNSAVVAKSSFTKPNDVFVIDSKLASGALILIVDKLTRLIQEKIPFEEICKTITDYVNNQIELLFTLKDYSNFVKNGRLTPMQALIASTLKITPLCAGEDGQIKIVKKLLGSKRVLKEIINVIKEKKQKYSFSKCIITHADNQEVAEQLKQNVNSLNLFSKVEILPMQGLCSFYAMRKGLIVSFEK